MQDQKPSLPPPAEVREAKAPKTAEQQADVPANGKTWEYCGPKENDAVIRIPGDPKTYHPHELPQQHIPFYRQSTPQYKDWWK